MTSKLAMFDDAILHALRLDGLYQDAQKSMGYEVALMFEACEGHITGAIEGMSFRQGAPKSMQMLGRVSEAFGDDIRERVRDYQGAALETTLSVLRDALAKEGAPAKVLDALRPDAFEDMRSARFDGRTWDQWAMKTVDDFTHAMASATEAALVTNGNPVDLVAEWKGIAQRAVRTLNTTAQGAINFTRNLTTERAVKIAGPDLVAGLRFVAVLDGRTSTVCRGLDGTIWRPDDPDIPRPPRHPNCRSVLVPILQSDLDARDAAERERVIQTLADGGSPEADINARFTTDLLVKVPGRPGLVNQLKRKTPTVPAYEEWLARQSVDIQREVLGPTRYRAWRKGVPLSRMATYGRALTIAELKALYPEHVT